MSNKPIDFPISIALEENPDPADVAAIEKGLADYNNQFSEGDNHEFIYIMLRDSSNQLAGGLLAETFWRWLHVNILWLRQDLRQQGYGSRMLHLAEQEAVRRGCRHSQLETHEFQALPFYQKHRYVVFAELPDMPPDHIKYFLKKDLPDAI
jgi:GNAT superfamily N-acetyltransferase